MYVFFSCIWYANHYFAFHCTNYQREMFCQTVIVIVLRCGRRNNSLKLFFQKLTPFILNHHLQSKHLFLQSWSHSVSGFGFRVYVFAPSIKAAVVARLSKCCLQTPSGHCDSVSIVLEVYSVLFYYFRS